MRVYPSNESVIAAYLQQYSVAVRNPGNTLSFRGTKLYSYESLLAIIEPLDKVIFIDENIRNYSNTTAKQTYLLISNTYSFTTYSVPLNKSPKEVLTFYWEKIDKLIKKFDKARILHELYKAQIKSELNQAQSYIEYMNVSKQCKEYKHINQITKELFKRKIL
jgi:hypothetical protein